jgi:hypothetical protein
MIEASKSEFGAKRKKQKGALWKPLGPGKQAKAKTTF